MTEAVVGVVTDKLVSLLTQEVSLLKDVDEEVEEIANELGSILSLLKDADKKAETEGDNVSDGVKSWVQELREVALQVEDLVTDYKHHMTDQQPHPSNQWSFVEYLQEITCFLPFCYSSLERRRDLARQIQKMKKNISMIQKRGISYGFMNYIQQGPTSNATQNVLCSYDPREASRYLDEDEIVGIESDREKLVGVLLDESSQRVVIPVVGMGGSGKTTLAQQVYDRLRGSFQCHAWVQVPRQYTREEILRTLIRDLFEATKTSVPAEISEMDVGKLTNKLREYLKGKKYLVVFDDVWKDEFWGDIEHALSNNKVGCRIMITTRKIQVAKFCESFSSVHIHEMQHLPAEKAWELFCKRTFRPEGCCPKELEKISGEIIERCEGLPLAIVVIAGTLSRKNKTINEWRKFLDSLSSELENNVHLASIINILSLSYNELPYNLKSCFLYFGMFPRGRSIRKGRLIRQWIAEGFVKAVKDKSLEEVAQGYMIELINRSLVEASDVDVAGKARECRVHDLLHEIILMKTKEVCFSQVFPGHSASRFGGIIRRLSITINSSNDDLRGNKFPHAHSAIVFCEDETLNSIIPVFGTNLKFVKVLDFEDASRLDHLPEDIGNLFDLRYLSVRGTNVKLLPRSVEKLKNLETLDLSSSFVCELPANMIKSLSKLRNIYAFNIRQYNETKVSIFGHGVGLKVVCEIGLLNALQKLLYIELDCSIGVDDPFKELSNLTQLRTLGVLRVRSEDWRSLCGCVEKMELLESLIVGSTSENEFVDLEGMKSPPQLLRNINFYGRLKKLPEWFTQLQHTLVKLRLNYSRLEDDPLQVLQNMHNLLHLEINYEAYVGEQLCFKEGMFAKLKKLGLMNLTRLRSVIIEETALPMLEHLLIGPCPELKELPSGLQHLKKLKVLLFNRMPLEFMFTEELIAIDFVPQILFNYRDEDNEEKIFNMQGLLEALRGSPESLLTHLTYLNQNEEEQVGASTSTGIDEHQAAS